MDDQLPPSNDYALGHTQRELERLVAQDRFIGDLTEHILLLAGLKTGMRVLDVGCGAGDVSFLVARLVSPQGAVIGVDRSAEAIAAAQQRAKQAQLTNVQFLVADLNQIALDEPVDALIGRLVLMYFPQPAAVLRNWLRFVKPGGIIAFQELDAASAAVEPMCDIYWNTGQRINQAFQRGGIEIRTGLKLGAIFQEAGLPAPQNAATGAGRIRPELASQCLGRATGAHFDAAHTRNRRGDARGNGTG